MLSRRPVAPVLRCTVFVRKTKHVLLLVCWGCTAGSFVFLQVAGSAGRFSPFVSLSLFFTAVGHFRALEHAIAISVVSVADADCPLLGDREGKPSRACLVVQRPVHSRTVKSQHPEESTRSLVLSLRFDRRQGRESHCSACALRACSCMAEVNKLLKFCLGVSCKKRIVCFVLAHTWSRLLFVHPPVDTF